MKSELPGLSVLSQLFFRMEHRRRCAERSRGEIQGENGFGYDPIFYVPEYGCTTAEMPPEQKNELSHRGNALRAIRKIMEDKIRERENA
mgnify:CR=1 FL=1